MKTPTVITQNADGTQTVSQFAAELYQKQAFVTPDATDPATLTASLTRLQKSVADIGKTAAANPLSGCMIFANIGVPASGGVTLSHGLGYVARWFIVRWKNASAGHNFVESPATDTNTLVLLSSVAGTADIAVF